jgi:REP element-mobilizing transposase RayT
MGNKRPPFEPDTVFHVYNHGNAEDNIFREEENYYYFLKRYAEYIYPVAKTYAFCLLPNHFHLAVEIRPADKLVDFFQEKYPDRDPQSLGNFADLLSNQFKNFLISYAKSFNKMYDRKGSLFLDNINRKPITNQTYYKNLISYIHRNPVEHGFAKHPVDWPFSSYQIILAQKKTQLEREQVLNWFGGKEAFVENHEEIDDINRDEFY